MASRSCHYGTYRHWIADFCKRDPNRLVGLVPLTGNPEQAVREVNDAARLGIRGVELKPRIAEHPGIDESFPDAG